jgi:hypothetical protein
MRSVSAQKLISVKLLIDRTVSDRRLVVAFQSEPLISLINPPVLSSHSELFLAGTIAFIYSGTERRQSPLDLR